MSSYRVEIMADNEWRVYSWHKNPEYADVIYDVQTKAGNVCRIVHQGLVVRG